MVRIVVEDHRPVRRVHVVSVSPASQRTTELFAVEHALHIRVVGHHPLEVALGERPACGPREAEVRARQAVGRCCLRVANHSVSSYDGLADERNLVIRVSDEHVARFGEVLFDVADVRGQHSVLVLSHGPHLHQTDVVPNHEVHVRINLHTEVVVGSHHHGPNGPSPNGAFGLPRIYSHDFDVVQPRALLVALSLHELAVHRNAVELVFLFQVLLHDPDVDSVRVRGPDERIGYGLAASRVAES
mmetsp:Transcript_24256/g.42973  ORF Transcript_24256/g.42973 Transcript_24256/m.42973 type:complete len:244 (+) Transcript_24256:848-1579(+)